MAGHVLRNSVGAALSMTGLQVGLMFSGVLVVEQVFGWPGIGQYIAQSIPVADFPGDRRRHPDARRALRRHQHGGRPAAGRRRSTHRSQQEVRCRNSHSSWAIPCWSSSTSRRAAAMPAEDVGIPIMPGHAERVERAETPVAAARAAGVPVVFFQEVHRPSGVDFGRELDGTEGVHCVEGQPGTDLEPTLRPDSTVPTRVPHRQAALLRFHRNGIRDRAARAEGVDADPHRRPDRRLRALHVRRRAPARLLRPRGHRLRRRLVAVPARRGARRHGVPADRRACAPPTRSSPRSHELARPHPSSKEPAR